MTARPQVVQFPDCAIWQDGAMRWLIALACVSSTALANPTLRIATLAPDGTAWAHELRDWADGLEKEARGAVAVKLYFGGLAGDEPEVFDRIGRGQLDGALSGGHVCERVAPSLRVMKVPGLIRDHEEAAWALGVLRPVIDRESRANGFVTLASSGLGPVIVFSRKPARTMAELRALKLWSGRNEVLRTLFGALGLHVTDELISDAFASYTAGKIDGFLTTPSAALAWQWTSQARFFMNLRLSFIASCLVVTTSSFEALSLVGQDAVRTAVARLLVRSERQAREQDDALLTKIFPKQGLQAVPVDARLAEEFNEASRAIRAHFDPKQIAPDVLRDLLARLADYRADHPTGAIGR
jgi:TRAP-type C4-dicarboxylate transport system substrate-binding protein